MLHGPKVLRSATNTTTLGTPSTNIIMEQVDDDDLQALVPPAGYNEPDVEWRAIDEETLLKIENGEEDINGL